MGLCKSQDFFMELLASYYMLALRVRFSCQERSRLRSKRPNQISNYVVIRLIRARHNHFVKNGVATRFTLVLQVNYP